MSLAGYSEGSDIVNMHKNFIEKMHSYQLQRYQLISVGT